MPALKSDGTMVDAAGPSGPAASEPGAERRDTPAQAAKRQAASQSWRDLLALDADLFDQKGVRLLTPEARVLINLKLGGSLPVSTAMKLAGTSYRGFYAVLERLKQAGLIAQAKDQNDQRVRNLRLDPSGPLPPDQI